MTEEEYRREQEEAARLVRRINEVINQINRINQENAELDTELNVAKENVGILIKNCSHMDKEVYKAMGDLSGTVGTADINTKEVFQALNELTVQYFTFKSISTASKNVTRYTDEYNTKFAYYNELRRISLGFVIGLDLDFVSSEARRKKVEKAYLQNTEYWLAYCISAVMLWEQKEKEAANRAVRKSLSINYFNSCLFYLLINLRFNRIDAAKKWYVNYLDRADMNNLGDEWKYLLQAYLFGAFGADEDFQNNIETCFKDMLAQIEVTTVDFAKKFIQKAIEFADTYAHKTEHEYTTLGRTCSEYLEMKNLLSLAEKNAEIAKYYNAIGESEVTETQDLPQRIEDVLYDLISDYDDEELKVVRKIKYNNAIISARGDVAIAQANYKVMFENDNKRKNLGDLLLAWAFADEINQTDVSVQRFAISFMKEAIIKGFEQFAEKYREKENDKYSFSIDNCMLECSEDDIGEASQQLDKYYDKNKLKDTFKDKQVLIYTGMCVLSIGLVLVLIAFFSPVILTFGILIGLAGSFLLWRRIVDMGKILKEKKRKGKQLLGMALEELKQWKAAYKEADAQNGDIIKALEIF